MKHLSTLLAVTLALALGTAHADDEKKAPTAQQQRMADCNAQAAGKSGDERKKFMSECLKAKPAAATAKGTAQQERMRQCNADAQGKTGDERRKFMSECLKNK